MKPLESNRFHYRPLDERDLDLYVRIYTDTALMRHVGNPLSAAAAQRSFENSCAFNRAFLFRQRCWVLSDNDTREEVGLLALIDHGELAEIGVMVLPSWQNRRVAQEAIRRLVDSGFYDYLLKRVFTRHLIANTAGAGVMKRLEFHPMCEVPGGARFQGWYMDRDEWIARHAPRSQAIGEQHDD